MPAVRAAPRRRSHRADTTASIYGNMYGMRRTTVYLPEDLKLDLERVAQAEARSEAQLIREGIRLVVDRHRPLRPQVPLFESGDPTLAERADDLLEGFGRHGS